MTFTLDALERIAWTAIEAAGGAAIDVLEQGHVTWRAALYAIGLAALKAVFARNIGSPDDASTLRR